MAGEGAILRQAREEKGWSYRDIEESIKIRVRYLEALEKEEYDILPGTTYVKGFLRSYSKHLGLNPEEIISLYNSSKEKEPSPQLHAPLTPIQSTPVWFKPIVVIVMALFAASIVLGITYLSKMNENPQISQYTPTPLPTAPETPKKPTNQTQEKTQPNERQEQQTVQY
jgi:cytoskeletal protein RodZ